MRGPGHAGHRYALCHRGDGTEVDRLLREAAQETPAVGESPQPPESLGGVHRFHLDGLPAVGGQDADAPHGQRRGAKPFHRRQILLQIRPYLLLCLPPPVQLVERVRPQPRTGKGGQGDGMATGVQDDPRHVVGQHGVAAPDQRREQRGLAFAGTAREQHRAGTGLDGAGMNRGHGALLQQRGEHRAGEEYADVMIVAARGFDQDVAPVPDQVSGDIGHVEQKGAGGALPEATSVGGTGERRRRRAEANRHVRLAARRGREGGEGQGDGRTHVQPIGREVARRAAHAGWASVYSSPLSDEPGSRRMLVFSVLRPYAPSNTSKMKCTRSSSPPLKASCGTRLLTSKA